MILEGSGLKLMIVVKFVTVMIMIKLVILLLPSLEE